MEKGKFNELMPTNEHKLFDLVIHVQFKEKYYLHNQIQMWKLVQKEPIFNSDHEYYTFARKRIPFFDQNTFFYLYNPNNDQGFTAPPILTFIT